MDLIVCFCIIFIGILIFWEFSKKLLVKTVESLASTNGSPDPIKLLDLSKIVDPAKELSAVQSKLNELIRAFNKLQEDAKDQNTAVNIKDLDLSTTVGTEKELRVVQSKLNEMIGAFNKYRADAKTETTVVNITNLDFSKTVGTAKELSAVQLKLNELIYAFNKNQTDMNKEGQEKITIAKSKAEQSKATAKSGNKQNKQMNTWLKNR